VRNQRGKLKVNDSDGNPVEIAAVGLASDGHSRGGILRG
jgi:hypothetical protein